MLQFTIKTKDVSSTAALLSQVSSLKSHGAAVIEKCGLQVTGNTLILTAINEANSIRIENIPIEVVNGSVGDFADRTTMVDLKKLTTGIKQSKESVNVSLEDTNVVIQSNKAKYTLDAYRVDRDIPQELHMSDKAIKVKELKTLFEQVNLIIQNVSINTTIAGCLISGNQLFSTDRSTALYLKNTGLLEHLPPVSDDILFSPDLFALSLGKVEAEECFLGLTKNGDKFVISAGNVTLYKSLMAGQYEKAKILKVVENIKKITEENGVFATVDLSELIDAFNDYQKIVEQDSHTLTITRDNQLIIHSKNSKIGIGGEVSIALKNVKMPEALGKSFGGNFSTSSIQIVEEIFGNKEKKEQELRMGIITVNKSPTPNIIAFDTEDKLLFIIPRK